MARKRVPERALTEDGTDEKTTERKVARQGYEPAGKA
jgi:hypothetical protein